MLLNVYRSGGSVAELGLWIFVTKPAIALAGCLELLPHFCTSHIVISNMICSSLASWINSLRALALEMEAEGLNFEREKSMLIYYRGNDIGTRRVDFFVEDCV